LEAQAVADEAKDTVSILCVAIVLNTQWVFRCCNVVLPFCW
jgi:hypothetical protein